MATAENTVQHTMERPGAARRADPVDTARRIQRLVAAFRLLVAVGLLIAGLAYRDAPIVGERYPELFIFTAIAYAIVAAGILVIQQRSAPGAQDLAPLQLFTDVVCVTLMMHASGGISSGIGGLLVVFVGAASVTLRGQLAIFAAAISALAVLTEQTVSYTGGVTPADDFMPAGFLGAIIFTIALAAHPLARRLQESEALAHQRGIDLANMAQLNEYIIQNLRESIVVVDERDKIRLINQSAAEHLGVQTAAPGEPLGALTPRLQRVLADWRSSEAGTSTMSTFQSADGSTTINTYMAPLEGRSDGPVLIFLEDATQLAQKVQQTKLAALGRLSASIAHEIRNPVGALSHAGQLLEESPAIGDEERRLLSMIGKHSQRVNEIVENVLQLSRREETRPESIAIPDWLGEFVEEFGSTLELPARTFTMPTAPEPIEVRMDPSQLRQICWNLCENAVRYGTAEGQAPAIELRFGRLPGNRRPFLEIVDRGPGIGEAMRDQLFEPFATGRVGGTGLGLFISRELCECNGAALLYEPREHGGSLFRIVFADPKRWGMK